MKIYTTTLRIAENLKKAGDLKTYLWDKEPSKWSDFDLLLYKEITGDLGIVINKMNIKLNQKSLHNKRERQRQYVIKHHENPLVQQVLKRLNEKL